MAPTPVFALITGPGADIDLRLVSSDSTDPSPSPTSTSVFKTTTSPSSTLVHGWRAWDDRAIAFTILVGLCAVAAVIFVLGGSTRRQDRRRSRNAQQSENDTADSQSGWFGRIKSRGSLNSFRMRSPEVVQGVPLACVRTASERQASPQQRDITTPRSVSPTREDQPPAYTQPTQPQRAFFNPGHNSSRMTFDPMHTATTLPTYTRHPHDHLYEWESPEPAIEAARNLNSTSASAPSYARHWNQWSVHYGLGDQNH
jgi:hypothetical protein